MKRLLLTCLLALVVTLASTAWAQDRRFTHDLYPLKVGQQWTYRSGKETVVIRVEKEVSIEITRNEKKDQVISFMLKIGSGPREVAEQVAVLDDGVYRLSTAGKATSPALPFLKFKGDSWQVASKTEGDKLIHGTFVLGVDTIQLTINGKKEKLDAFTVTSKDFYVDDQEMSIKYWFARKTYGMVKQHIRTDKHEVTLELEEFNPGP
jgi:hypothetical protein